MTTTPDRPRAEDIEAIKRLVEAEKHATPGPYVYGQPGTMEWVETAQSVDGGMPVAKCVRDGSQGLSDAAFFAATRQGVPALLRAVRERGLGHRPNCWGGQFSEPCTCGKAEIEAALK